MSEDGELSGQYPADGGPLERPLPVGEWFRHATVELHDGELRYRRSSIHTPPLGVVTRAGPGMLEGFAGLHRHKTSVRDSRILAFARRWGALGKCSCGRPCGGHITMDGDKCVLPSKGTWELVEPVGWWIRLSSYVDALLGIDQDLRKREVPPPALWKRVYETFPRGSHNVEFFSQAKSKIKYYVQGPDPGLPGYREHLLASAFADFVNASVREAELMPYVVWRPGGRAATPSDRGAGLPDNHGLTLTRWSTDRASPRLWPALVAQLLAVVSGAPGFAFCSICGEPFASVQRPRSDRRAVCPKDACRKGNDALRARFYRDRKRAGRAAARRPTSGDAPGAGGTQTG